MGSAPESSLGREAAAPGQVDNQQPPCRTPAAQATDSPAQKTTNPWAGLPGLAGVVPPIQALRGARNEPLSFWIMKRALGAERGFLKTGNLGSQDYHYSKSVWKELSILRSHPGRAGQAGWIPACGRSNEARAMKEPLTHCLPNCKCWQGLP